MRTFIVPQSKEKQAYKTASSSQTSHHIIAMCAQLSPTEANKFVLKELSSEGDDGDHAEDVGCQEFLVESEVKIVWQVEDGRRNIADGRQHQRD